MQSCSIPNYFRQSELQKQGGFAVFAGLLTWEWHKSMLQEANNLFPYAQESKAILADLEEWRGGNPPRTFLSTVAGPVQQSFYHSLGLSRFLEQVTRLSVHLSGIQGTYCFYCRKGDYLSLHRDIEACDLAMITCLQDDAPSYDRGGVLCVYPNRYEEPLSQIRATLHQGCVPVHLAPNHTIIMYGGIIPHLITPTVNSQVRIVSILCFSIQSKSTEIE
jgi:hypothetical protein